MNLRKKGFQLPQKIKFDEDTLSPTFGRLVAEPFERGYGITVGNALRRVLLSSITGAAVTAIKIKGVLHEFSSIDGVKEDVVDIILNVKKIRLRIHGDGKKTGTIAEKGPKVVKAGDIKVDGSVEILNPDLTLATLDKGATLEMELFMGTGKGYVPAEVNKEADYPIGVIAVDSLFSPVKKVNFWVEKARVGRSTDYDKLIMEITTDGSVTPERAISEAAGILVEHFDLFILEEDAIYPMEERAGTNSQTGTATVNENLLKSIDELELSVRAHNCLKNANIQTIADLVQKTEQEMLKTKNFGRKSLNEIKTILRSMGLDFGMKIDMEALKALERGGKTNAP
ncbi:MAG: DNA-directed RNA polymerase subunit alpha [Thermodesulfovibrionales bacterium]|nr:DNA-directed RNA polymerase subunit alpha [Thermodesulfovibrionales bacterium]